MKDWSHLLIIKCPWVLSNYAPVVRKIHSQNPNPVRLFKSKSNPGRSFSSKSILQKMNFLNHFTKQEFKSMPDLDLHTTVMHYGGHLEFKVPKWHQTDIFLLLMDNVLEKEREII